MAGIDVAHGNRCAEGRAEATAAHLADHGAVGIDDFRTFTYRYALLRQQADALARYALLLLLEHALGAREVAGTLAIGAAHLGDGPQQAGFDRRCGAAHVVAVQAQAGFQAQRVTRTQADGLDFRFGQQAASQGFGLVDGDGNLEAVFAGVTAATDDAFVAQQAYTGDLHEGHFAHFRRQAGQHLGGLRALQGEQGALLEQALDLALLANVLLQVG